MCESALRVARNTAARGKGTIFPRASQLVAPHNQLLPTAGKRPVPAADSINSDVTGSRAAILAAHARGCKYSGVCYNEQFLSIKSGCYNELGGILSADVARACARRVGPSRFD